MRRRRKLWDHSEAFIGKDWMAIIIIIVAIATKDDELVKESGSFNRQLRDCNQVDLSGSETIRR